MKFPQTAEILELMHKKEFVRNVGIIAHIDHGKTTLSDSLLVEAGLLSRQVAGSARVLDYLEEEQKRGITIKAANVSFLHRMGKDTYLINLVDTPGHVDFVDRVSRALRAVDGVIVVVDAVEEIMAQTETVVRQALEERVRPLLFINKVDRLMRELRLSSGQMQKKFVHIINDFNDIIAIHGEPEFKEKWKVDPAAESVVFGSALYKWGFTPRTAKKKGIKLDDPSMMEAQWKANFDRLSETVPLHTAILDMVARHVPNPAESQKYRLPKIWKGNLASEIGRSMLGCEDSGPIAMCITQVKSFPDQGLIAAGRVFSGILRGGENVCLLNAGKKEQIQKVLIYMSAFRQPVGEIPAGNIAAVTGLQSARVGETIVDVKHADVDGVFEGFRRLSEPVMTVAIEPTDPIDLNRLVDSMNELASEDPDLYAFVDQETGQYLLSGLGELHLEISSNRLKQIGGGLDLKVSDPIASYRETALKKGAIVTAKSSIGLNEFWVQVEPLDQKTLESFEENAPSTKDRLREQISSLVEGNVLAAEEHFNVLVDLSEISKRLHSVLDAVISGFEWACRTGPLCGQPLRGLKVNITDAIVDTNPENTESTQISRAMSRSILGSFLTAEPILLEPISRIEVSVSLQWLGPCVNVIVHRHGKIESTEKKGGSATVRGYIPVAYTFGLATDLRSATSGHAFWQLAFHHWERMPDRRSVETIQKLREKKGLPFGVPKPETFVDKICS